MRTVSRTRGPLVLLVLLSACSEPADGPEPDLVITGATLIDAPSIRTLRSRAASGELTAPHIYATGSMLTLPGSHPVATIMRAPDGVDPTTYDWSARGVALVEHEFDQGARTVLNVDRVRVYGDTVDFDITERNDVSRPWVCRSCTIGCGWSSGTD